MPACERTPLTDANELPDGVPTNLRKGSRDNVVTWTPRLRAVWEAAKARRAHIWEDRKTVEPTKPELRFIITAEHGGPLGKSGLDTVLAAFHPQRDRGRRHQRGVALQSARPQAARHH